MSPGAHVDLQINAGVASISLVNPARHNAMNVSMWRDLARTVKGLDTDDTVRVIVLQGAGPSAFCAGADLSDTDNQGTGGPMRVEMNTAGAEAVAALTQCGKPVVAKIRGICIGGGMELASACDLRIAAEDTKFRMPAARLGIGYALKGIQRYVALMGPMHTFDIFATARQFNGQEALRMGFVARICAAEDLDDVTQTMVASIAELAPLTLKAMKLSVQACMAEPAVNRLATINNAIDACMESKDFREGVAAFKEKRPARFIGR